LQLGIIQELLEKQSIVLLDDIVHPSFGGVMFVSILISFLA
jgi:hypothetical protein